MLRVICSWRENLVLTLPQMACKNGGLDSVSFFLGLELIKFFKNTLRIAQLHTVGALWGVKMASQSP
ncbi:hypothetical protein SRHO_G00246760 [Serrasalmus rhombeus]